MMLTTELFNIMEVRNRTLAVEDLLGGVDFGSN